MCNVKSLLPAICICLLVIQEVRSYSVFESHNGTRVRRQSNRKNCKKPNFACKSGECIDGDKECDGAPDCRDASDESNACHRIKCPPYAFTCRYGACINKELECDAKRDCRDGSDENTPKCTTPDQTSPMCKENEFRCSSGQCIDGDLICDGKAECDDHSDEIRETCWNVKCPGFTYRCKYGACVNGKAECNGIVECFDGSDENPTVCVTPVVTTTSTERPVGPDTIGGRCVLPTQPEFGQWSAYVNGIRADNLAPGMSIANGAVLQVECRTGYKLEGNNVTFCNNGDWAVRTGSCLRVCPNIVSTATLEVTCQQANGQITQDCIQAVDNTLARFKCAPFYEDLSLKKHPVHICRDGSWDHQKPVCDPVCGQKTVDPTPLIINGKNVTKGDYPWQVAIYHQKILVCGGSLINQKMIVTAAHCITSLSGVLIEKENYIVAVGKYYRSFNDSRDFNEAQFSELEHMFIPRQYVGSVQNYFGDIAILVTKKTFTLSRRVQPVCLDRGGNYDPRVNDYGYVTGWGYTSEDTDPSDVLKEVKVPSVSLSTCKQNLPEDFHIYLTSDKMCAGYINNSTAVCKGDSGGGLVYKHDGRYYLTGIVSLSPNSPTSLTGGCDSQSYGLYTKVSEYIERFILTKESEFKPRRF